MEMLLETKLEGGRSGQDQSSSPKPGDQTNESPCGEKNDGEWYERANHPLLNELVLPMILDYARGKELKSCRLVCRKWSSMSIPFTRSRLLVSISGSCSTADVKNFNCIENFMKLISLNILGIPFGTYHLISINTTEGDGQQFLQLCGNTTVEIILSDNKSHNIESISEMLQSMPKLESFTIPSWISSKDGSAVQLFPGVKPKLNFLKFMRVGSDNANQRKLCPSFYEELLGAAPNISTFELMNSFSFSRVKDVRLDVLETLEKLGRESSILNLTLPQMEADILTVLRNMASKGMKLKKLYFEVKYFDWLELVTLFKDSLVSLSIFYHHTAGTVKFPMLPKLIVLDLVMFEPTNLSCEDFTKTFPALEEFRFLQSRQCDDFYNSITGAGELSSTMKSLIMQVYPILNIEMLNRILTIFPALTKLNCRVTEEDGAEVIQKIWTHMKQLQGLQIRGNLTSSENLDSLVTGISVQKIEQMRESDFFSSLGKTTTKIQRENILVDTMMNIDFELPSIRSLTNLRTLSLGLATNGSGVDTYNCITDFTAYFGLYSIKTLCHLYASECKFSELCCEILVKDMDLMTWSFESRFIGSEQIIAARFNHNDEYFHQ